MIVKVQVTDATTCDCVQMLISDQFDQVRILGDATPELLDLIRYDGGLYKGFFEAELVDGQLILGKKTRDYFW